MNTADDQQQQKGDPLAQCILDLCAARGSIRPEDAAQAYFEEHRRPRDTDEGWRRYMVPTKQQIVALARQGKVGDCAERCRAGPRGLQGPCADSPATELTTGQTENGQPDRLVSAALLTS